MVLLMLPGLAAAADPEFTGVLALAVEPDVASELGLSDDQLMQLQKLIDDHENRILARERQLRNLSSTERANQIAQWRTEVEAQGLALLSAEQTQQLEQMRLRRQGLASLKEDRIAAILELSAEQRQDVARLLADRAKKSIGADDQQQRLVRVRFERDLTALLSDAQRVKWAELTGRTAPAIVATKTAITPPADKTAATADNTQPAADTKPAADEPQTAAADTKPAADDSKPASEATRPDDDTKSTSDSPKPAAEEKQPADDTSTRPVGGATTRPSGEAADRTQGTDETAPRTPAATASGAGQGTARNQPNGQPTEAAGQETAPGDVKLTFAFRNAPWQKVLDWLAEQAGYSLYYVSLPDGTFNYTNDRRTYTPTEAIDQINSVLLTKGFVLLARDKILMVVNIEDGIPPSWVPFVSDEDLDKRGEFEIVNVLYQLDKFPPADAEEEINKIKGPQGAVVVLPKAKQLLVQDTAGRQRLIKKMIEKAEHPEGDTSTIRVFELKNISVDEAMSVIRPLVGMPLDLNATQDGSLRIALDPIASRLLVTGTTAALKQVEEIVQKVDVPIASTGGDTGSDQQLQLEIYEVQGPDPQTALQVLQTLMSGLAGVRLALDPATGNIVAHARPDEHDTIRAVIAQMTKRSLKKVKVFTLGPLADPATVQTTLATLFQPQTGTTTGGSSSAAAAAAAAAAKNAPTIRIDATTRKVVVLGTEPQIEQVETILNQLGWLGEEAVAGEKPDRRRVRLIPGLTGASGERAVEMIREILPTMRKNTISTPPANNQPASRGGPSGQRVNPSGGSDQGTDPGAAAADPRATPVRRRSDGQGVNSRQPDPRRSSPPDASGDRTARDTRGGQAGLLVLPTRFVRPGDDAAAEDESNKPADQRQAATGSKNTTAPTGTSNPNNDETGNADDAQSGGPNGGAGDGASNPLARQPERRPPGPARSPAAVVPSGGEEPGEDDRPGSPEDVVIIEMTPNGLMIASSDLDALDAIEELLLNLMQAGAIGPEDFTVRYLVNAKAESVAETLDKILGGGTLASDSSSGGGGGLLGDVVGSAFGGGALGSAVGNMLFGGSGGSGSVGGTGILSIVPDERLNALFIQGDPPDVARALRIIDVLDRADVPENGVNPRPQIIPVYYTSAERIAANIREVFQTRIVGAGGQQRQPSPEEFIRALRGGGNNRNQRQRDDESTKMTLSVDTQANALIVAAPDDLFAEVEALVRVLDQAAVEQADVVQEVITLKKTGPQAVTQALRGIVGDKVVTNTVSAPPSSNTTGAGTNTGSTSGQNVPFTMSPERAAFFEALRSGRSPFGTGGGGFPGGGFPGGGGGFPGGGSGFFPGGGGGFFFNRGGGDSGRGFGGDSGRGFGGGDSGRGFGGGRGSFGTGNGGFSPRGR
jgi:type II secretory pathway component GspD/PulD (secretin)